VFFTNRPAGIVLGGWDFRHGPMSTIADPLGGQAQPLCHVIKHEQMAVMCVEAEQDAYSMLKGMTTRKKINRQN
jgi:hypothetical protein